MGVGVSDWRLARAVAMQGQLGVVSGTSLAVVLARRLQMGDRDGQIRSAMEMFPFEQMAAKIIDRYFVAGGKPADAPFISVPLLGINPTREQLELLVVANYVEVYLAKEEHLQPIGINYLEKLQVPTLPSLFGAMLAHVDYVLMGAGIPRHIPEVLDRLSEGLPVELPLHIAGADSTDRFVTRFDPEQFTGGRLPWLTRPKFIAIVASATLAIMLARKSKGTVDGFIVEGPTAGGHNAPPRGALKLNQRGEPVYGQRDDVEFAAFRKLGLPFWIAGSYGTPERIHEALQTGAAGVQIGTAFAFCEESGIDSQIKQRVLAMSREGTADVYTDPVASPTGFPFKLLSVAGSVSENAVYHHRDRVCDLGYLRTGYKKPDGTVGWRCPGERVKSFINKGGQIPDTVGRKCVCNGLFANIGLPQIRKKTGAEPPMVTCGNEVGSIHQFAANASATSYTAKQVIDTLLPQETLIAVGAGESER
jgi:nitronate monooxygenase